MKKQLKNKTTIINSDYDKTPYTKCSSNWNDYTKLDGYERAICLEIKSNNPYTYVIVKYVIQKRLKFPRNKFNMAWNSLEEKGFLIKIRILRGVHWTFNERSIIAIGGNNKINETEMANPIIAADSTTTGGHLTITNNNYLDTQDLSPKATSEPLPTDSKFSKENIISNQEPSRFLKPEFIYESSLPNITEDHSLLDINIDIEDET
jgi:hypothetical protein